MIQRLGALALLALLASSAAAENIRLSVYHTNDVHGNVSARPAQKEFYPDRPGRPIGGFPALAAFLKKEPSGPRLLLDAGDWFQGTPEGNGSKGEVMALAFKTLGYDAVAIGNHDFDFGAARLEELIKMMGIPALGSNILTAQGGYPEFVTSWLVKDVGGVKVGMFGLITSNMKNLSHPDLYGTLTFEREAELAREAIGVLSKQGATVIIAVTHVGVRGRLEDFEDDLFLAKEVEGIDLIVGGHSHTFLSAPLREPTHGTLIVQAGSTLARVGKAVLEIDPATKRVVSSTATLVPLWVDDYGEDPAVKQALAPFVERASKLYDVVIATAAESLMRDRFAESALGDWMADCERDWAKTDVAIQNGGGIQADIPVGLVTLRQMLNVMPFENRITRLTMSGALLRDTLDYGMIRTKAMIQVSGASFSYDRDAEPGKRVDDVRIGGKPLDPAARYSVAALDYNVRGGDGFTMYQRADKTEFTQGYARDVLTECARRQQSLRRPAGGRMTPRSGSKDAGPAK
ncbi:MAG: bifunctional metallophosphatase/5'-nucleotidase [Elusimicrobia bacterium]|nr:bifunctional metallophosphatase/5'-nucleotidase [Elusimicrobiota bacterium]